MNSPTHSKSSPADVLSSSPPARAARRPAFRNRLGAGLQFLMLLLTSILTPVLFAAVIPGTAPISPPIGGFGIDGDLYANTPTVNIGDWTGGAGGSGTGVLDASGNPITSTTTFHLTDLYNSGSDNNFAGGLKVDDDPNLWTWVSNPVGDKVDINNALLHFSTDSSGHQWLAIAGDRLSDNGDAYIDFEFLQKTLSANDGGSFSSAGLAGGRTVNDFMVTLKLTKGGSTAEFFVQRWESVGTGYDYVDYSPPAGATFAAVNPAAITSPYPAFGGTTYLKNTFSEAAVDLTALIGAFDPCLSLGIRTVMVKTKVSQAATATIVDFISPLQVSLTLGVANAGPDQSVCSGSAAAEFALSGTATPSPGDTVTSTTWSVVSGSASIAAPGSLNTTATVTSASATLRLTVNTTKGCTVTDEVVLTVKPEPLCGIELLTPIPLAGEPVSFQAPTGSDNYAWSVEYDNSGTSLSVGGNSPNLTFTIEATAKTAVVRLVVSNLNGCTGNCSLDVGISSPAECIAVANPATCPNEQQTARLSGTPPPGTEITWTISPALASLQLNVAADKRSATITSTTCVEYTITITTSLNGITSTCTTAGRFEDTLPPVIVCPDNRLVECTAPTDPAATGSATATDNCGSVALTRSDVVTAGNCPGNYTIARTWTATDDCGNTASCVQTITVRDIVPPVIACPADTSVECKASTDPTATGSATATDNCSGVTLTRSDVTTPGNCPGNYSIARTWTATDGCGNSASCVQTITVRDMIPPFIVCPADTSAECTASTDPTATGSATATDNCSGVTITHRDVTAPGSCAGNYTIARTWTATDGCGNTATCVQNITVRDTVPPFIVCPPDRLVDCTAPTDPAATGSATATDNCSGVTITHRDVNTSGTCPGNYTITRTWTATDGCENTSTCVQTIRVGDTTAPVVSRWPANVNMTCAACDINPANTGEPVVAADDCGTVTTSYQDVADSGAGTCPRVVNRLWTVSDGCNEVTYEQIIQCLPTSNVAVTNSSLCTYDMDPSTDCKDFRLLFTQDPKNFPKYRVTASNPGQTYYNLFYNGTPGSTVTFNIILPYPYVTQGAQPVHAYDGVTVRMQNGETCYEPGRGFYVGSTQVMLTSYSPQTYGSATSFSVPLVVPSTGFIYLNVHLDYGLKGSTGYSANSNGDAVNSTGRIVIPNRGTYTFSSSFGSESGSDSICNINVFKKLPGAGGFAGIPYATPDGSTGRIPKPGCTAVLKDSNGVILSNGLTDSDGWYFCNFKWSGKQSTVFVTLTPPGGRPITRSATMKSNGYAQIDFDTP